jgi:hypothetical protein
MRDLPEYPACDAAFEICHEAQLERAFEMDATLDGTRVFRVEAHELILQHVLEPARAWGEEMLGHFSFNGT